jgi:hypothetical protein
MHSFTEPNLTSAVRTASSRESLHDAIDSAHTRAGNARNLAATILSAAVRLYSEKGSVRGWLWRYAG